MPNTRLSFKEMCAQFDVTPRTLRHYEEIELLTPAREGRNRFYSGREIARMTLIMRGRRFGFSLEEIRQWLLIYDNQGSSSQNRIFLDYADTRLQALRLQLAELDETIKDLTALRNNVARTMD